MHTNGVCLKPDLTAIYGHYHSFCDHFDDSLSHLFTVVQHSACLAPGYERTIRIVCPVGKEFKGDRDGVVFGNGLKFAPVGTGQNNEYEIPIQTCKGFCYSIPHINVLDGHVVESPVWLYMLEPDLQCSGKCLKRAQLVGYIVSDLFQGGIHVSSSKPDQIRKTGVSARTYSVFLGE